MTNRRKAILALITAMAIWAISAVVIKYTLQFIPPFTLLFLRLFLVCLVIFPFLNRELKQNPFSKKDALKLIILSLFGQTINLTLTFIGFDKTSALEGLLVSTIGPVMTITAGVLILKERLVHREKIGLAIIFMGSLLPISHSVSAFKNGTSLNLWGDLILLAGALTWVIFAILSKELFEKYKPLPVTLFTFYVGLITFLPLMLWEQIFNPAAAQMQLLPALPGILYLAFLSSIVGYIFYEFGLEHVEASEADVFAYLGPLFAVPAAFLILNEIPTSPMVIGGLIIALGVVVYNKGSSLQRHHIRRSKI